MKSATVFGVIGLAFQALVMGGCAAESGEEEVAESSSAMSAVPNGGDWNWISEGPLNSRKVTVGTGGAVSLTKTSLAKGLPLADWGNPFDTSSAGKTARDQLARVLGKSITTTLLGTIKSALDADATCSDWHLASTSPTTTTADFACGSFLQDSRLCPGISANVTVSTVVSGDSAKKTIKMQWNPYEPASETFTIVWENTNGNWSTPEGVQLNTTICPSDQCTNATSSVSSTKKTETNAIDYNALNRPVAHIKKGGVVRCTL